MKDIKKFFILLLAGFLVVGCETEMVDTLDVFNLPNGGYMRIVTPFPVNNSTFKVSKANMAGTKMELVHEAVTPEKGAKFASYDLEMQFVGASTIAYKAFKSVPASAYAKDATTGYPRHTLAVTGAEAMTTMGLDTSKIKAGDRFVIRGTMKLTDGQSFNAANTGVNITGGAFYSSPFMYTINVTD